jgi:RNA polymerase sigma-70 factor, ECF subfamily
VVEARVDLPIPVILARWPSSSTARQGLNQALGEIGSRPERQVREMGNGEATEIDRQVVLRAQRGDRQAFREIVDHYEERLRLLAYQLLHDAEAMNDALQDTFVKAHRALPAFRAEAALGTWLYRICYRVCLDYLRKDRTRPALEPLDGELADPAQESDSYDLREQLTQALAALPLEHRTVLVLVDHAGYDYASVAAVLGIPAGTVASRLSVARAAIRAVLRPEREGRAQ